MGQNHCRREAKVLTDMTADMAPTEQAKGWANKLIGAAHRGPGDTVEAAMHRAARKHGLDPKVLWRLRYRTPKDMLASVYVRIKAAYEAECERQEEKLRHELEITRALSPTPDRLRLIREVETVLGQAPRTQGGTDAERTNGEG